MSYVANALLDETFGARDAQLLWRAMETWQVGTPARLAWWIGRCYGQRPALEDLPAATYLLGQTARPVTVKWEIDAVPNAPTHPALTWAKIRVKLTVREPRPVTAVYVEQGFFPTQFMRTRAHVPYPASLAYNI